MASDSRRLTAAAGMCGLALFLLPGLAAHGQGTSPRIRSGSVQQTGTTAAQTTPPSVAAPPPPVNMLQQPARDAQVTFAGDRLSIHADNSSLESILRQIAAQSGMKISGLANDERVFGTFGPGTPSDVLSDLLNGTAYDVMLVGSASYGAPRELILSPSRTGGAHVPTVAAPSQAVTDDAVNDQESQDGPPPPPDVPPPSTATPAGVRTPQQLFQQLQQMRQAQQQGIPQPDQQTQTPPQ